MFGVAFLYAGILWFLFIVEEKILHSEEHLERFTELDGEEKREEGDRGDQEEKRENQKGRDQSIQ